MTVAIDSKVADFYVDRETHYQHHQFMGSFIAWVNKTRNTAWKSFVSVVVFAVLTLLVFGFIFWGKANLK